MDDLISPKYQMKLVNLVEQAILDEYKSSYLVKNRNRKERIENGNKIS